MKRNLLIGILLIVALVLAACAPANGEPGDEIGGEAGGDTGEDPLAPAQPDLSGTSWQLESMLGETPIEGTTPTLEFTDTELMGDTGCNQYTGTYELDGTAITVGELIQTEMACTEPEGVMDQEAAYLSTLASAASVSRTDGQLELLDVNGSVVLTYSQQ